MPGRARVQVLLALDHMTATPPAGTGPSDHGCRAGDSSGGWTRVFTFAANSADVYLRRVMQSRKIIDRIAAKGQRKVARKGSRVQLKHPTKPGRVLSLSGGGDLRCRRLI